MRRASIASLIVVWLGLGAAVACGKFGENDAVDAGAVDGGAADAGSAGTVLLSLSDHMLSGVVATETSVYFSDQTSGLVHIVPLDGGAASAVSTSAGSPLGVARTTKALAWIDGDLTHDIDVRPDGDASIKTLAEPMAPVALTAAGDVIATITLYAPGTGRVDLRSPDDLTSSFSWSSLNQPFDVAVRAKTIYWTETGTSKITRAIENMTPTTVIADNETDCQAITVDGAGVYWTRPPAGTIRAWVEPNGPPTDLATGESSPSAIAADGQAVYWVTAKGELRRKKHGGTTIDTIASGFMPNANAHGHTLALTALYAVWVTQDGKILRHEK